MTVNVYHKHSVVKDKAPEAKQIELGEIALNANQSSPALYIKDSADAIVKVGGDFSTLEKELEELKFLVAHLEELLGEIPNPENVVKLLKTLAALEAQCLLLAQHNKEQDDNIKALVDADIKLGEDIEKLNAYLETQLTELHKMVAALEAQVLLSAKHNADQDRHLEKIDKSLRLHEQDIMALVKRIEALEKAIDLNLEALEKRVIQLEGIEIKAGIGIKVEMKDPSANKYGFTVKIDKEYLDERIQKAITEALKPYALKDISENTPELDDI